MEELDLGQVFSVSVFSTNGAVICLTAGNDSFSVV